MGFVQDSVLRREAAEHLRSTGVIRFGHFVSRGIGGRDELHSRVYVDPDNLFRNSFTSWKQMQVLHDLIPQPLKDECNIVAGPTTGGVVLAHNLAGLISSSRKLGCEEVLSLFIRKDSDGIDYHLRPSDKAILDGKNIILVDDVLNRGRTFAICATLIAQTHGRIIATAEIVDRGNKILPVMIGPPPVPNFFVERLSGDQMYTPAQCPMCEAGIPITKF